MIKLERINSEMLKQIADIVKNDLTDTRLDEALISVLSVECDKALTLAKIHISVYSTSEINSQNKCKEVQKALKSAREFIRNQLKKRMKIRNIPQLDFRIDDSINQGMKIDEIIKTKL